MYWMQMMILSSLMCMLLSILFYLINKNDLWDYKTMSSFECGFTNSFNSRYSFSIQYMYLTIMFLFLDLEICMMFPYFLNNIKMTKMLFILTLINLLIMMMLYLEQYNNSMEWSK